MWFQNVLQIHRLQSLISDFFISILLMKISKLLKKYSFFIIFRQKCEDYSICCRKARKLNIQIQILESTKHDKIGKLSYRTQYISTKSHWDQNSQKRFGIFSLVGVLFCFSFCRCIIFSMNVKSDPQSIFFFESVFFGLKSLYGQTIIIEVLVWSQKTYPP